jgi:p-aminobenzoyl-glutamate transporter AbgT
MNISRDIFFTKKQIYPKLYQRIKMENVKICETITKLDAKGIKKALMNLLILILMQEMRYLKCKERIFIN